MYSTICLSPDIFQDKSNLSNIKNLLASIEINGYLLIDDEELLISEYKKNISDMKDLDEDEKFESRILLEAINNGVNISYLGKISTSNILESLYKKIKSLKLVKFINSNKYYEIKNRIDYFYLILSKSQNKDESIVKQKYSEFIEDYESSKIKFTLKKQLNGKNIKNADIDDILLNWIVPIIWNTTKLSFFTKDISTDDARYKNTSRNSFKKYVEEIIKILVEIHPNYKNVEILIITGSSKKEVQNQLKIDLINVFINYFIKRFPGLNIKLLFKTESEDIDLLHDRFIVSDNVCVKFSKNPQIMQKCYNQNCGFLNFYYYETKRKNYCRECASVLDAENDILYFSHHYNSLTRDQNYLPEAKKLTIKKFT